MPKPIFLVGIPHPASHEDINNIRENLSLYLDGYYVIVYGNNTPDVSFKCFYEKDFDEIKFEELKQIVANQLPF